MTRVWLAERTYSDDEQNVLILEYATPDGTRYLRKERALTSLEDRRETPVAMDVDPDRLGEVRREVDQRAYAEAVSARQAEHDPDDVLRA